MKKITLLICILCLAMQSSAQVQKLSGPRIGITYITPGSTMDFLNDIKNNKGVNSVITQFGWQFESRFAESEKFTGIVEYMLFVGGVEQGFFLPSASFMIGGRGAGGFEFAIGPNLSLSGAGIVIGFGNNLQVGDLNIPFNFAFVPSKITNNDQDYIYHDSTGHRFTFTVGFNLAK